MLTEKLRKFYVEVPDGKFQLRDVVLPELRSYLHFCTHAYAHVCTRGLYAGVCLSWLIGSFVLIWHSSAAQPVAVSADHLPWRSPNPAVATVAC